MYLATNKFHSFPNRGVILHVIQWNIIIVIIILNQTLYVGIILLVL